jgi:hypothetical protein
MRHLIQQVCLSAALRGFNKELARRDAVRGQGSFRWFTPEEAAVAQALANTIVPTADESVGLDDIDVLGPSAIELLDKLIAACPDRQPVYARGLLSFDVWANKEHGCNFAELSKADQTMLFASAQRGYEEWNAGVPIIVKAWRRIRSILRAPSGRFFAAQLYSQVRGDCIRVFYTSRVSWIWLEYDGPPMDEGYPRLAARSEVHTAP